MVIKSKANLRNDSTGIKDIFKVIIQKKAEHIQLLAS